MLDLLRAAATHPLSAADRTEGDECHALERDCQMTGIERGRKGGLAGYGAPEEQQEWE